MIFRTISRSGAARALAATIRPARSSPALDVIAARHIEPIGGALAHRSHLALPRGFATDTERILGRKGGNRAEEEGVEKDEDGATESMRRRKAEDDEFAGIMRQKILNESMKHVASHGFTVRAIQRAVTEMGYSAALATLVPRGAGSLVEHFVDECDSRLSLRIATTGEDDLKDLTPEEKMVKVIGWRLDMLKEHAEHWGAALAVMGLPENLPTTLRQRAMLADELVGATGPTMTGLDSSKGGNITAAAKAAGFYGDRAAAGALYAACELFLVTDTSPGFADTDDFVRQRTREMFDLASGVEQVGGFAVRNVKSLINSDALPPFVKAELQKAVGGFGKVLGFAGFAPPPGSDAKKGDSH
jgi:ubiquinone biosynthesis protein COQ9